MIEEFLAEPRRAVPPSPGVRAEVVLREAASARLRRVVVDTTVLILLGLLTAIASFIVAAWLASAMAWRLAAALVTTTAAKAFGKPGVPYQLPGWVRWWLTYLLWGTLGIVLITMVTGVTLLATNRQNSPDESNLFAVTLLIQMALFGLLLTQALVRRYVVNGWYRFGRYHRDAPLRAAADRAATPYAARLSRFAAADACTSGQFNPAELIVHRGVNPFVGAGIRLEKWSWSTTFDLHPAKPGANGSVPTFDPMELQDFISKDLMALRETPTLTPGWRFSELYIAHWALLSSGHLLHYPEAEPLLRQLETGLNPQMRPEDWANLQNTSPEWLRYFRCYRVEGWERQLAVSTFLHVGCQQRTLFLEWQAFVLPPIDNAYRAVDEHRIPVLPEIWQALGEFALLPTTIPSRIGTLWRWVRERSGIRSGAWRSPAEAAHAFGARQSVREVGAGTEFTSFFEVTDLERYQRILRGRVFDAVHRFLVEKGISTAAFDQAVTQITSATYISNSNVVANAIGGTNNSGVMHGASMTAVSPGTPT
ncbi:hypothetical protein [Nocardia sp. NPDC004722]